MKYTDERTVTRRRALQAGVAGLGIALAGCLGDDDDTDDDRGDPDGIGGSGEIPDYASFVPLATDDDTDEEFAIAIVLDFEALDELADEEADSDPGEGEEELPEDPLIAIPVSGATGILLVALFGLGPTGLDGLVDEDEQEAFDSEVGQMLFSGGGLALTGEFVRDEIDETLTTVPEDDLFSIEWERVDERSGYEIYEPAQSDPDDTAQVAVGETELFVGGDDPEEFEAALDTAVGDRAPAHEQFDSFEWLLRTAGDGAMTFTTYTPDTTLDELEDEDDEGEEDLDDELLDDFDELTGATGFASTVSFDGEETVTATSAFTFEELDDDTRADLEEVLGAEGRDVSFEAEDGRVVAEATYDREEFEAGLEE